MQNLFYPTVVTFLGNVGHAAALEALPVLAISTLSLAAFIHCLLLLSTGLGQVAMLSINAS